MAPAPGRLSRPELQPELLRLRYNAPSTPTPLCTLYLDPAARPARAPAVAPHFTPGLALGEICFSVTGRPPGGARWLWDVGPDAV